MRGFSARRKDLTVQVERTVDSKLDNKVQKTTVKENPIRDFIIRVNNAVPLDHKMLH